MKTCIFCQIIKGVEPAHKIWESDEFLAFLSINVAELDPHRHIKQNQEELAEMAAKIRNEIVNAESEKI